MEVYKIFSIRTKQKTMINQKQKIRTERTNEMILTILNDIMQECDILLSECKKSLSECTSKETRIKINSLVDFYEDQKQISTWNLTTFVSDTYLNGNI